MTPRVLRRRSTSAIFLSLASLAIASVLVLILAPRTARPPPPASVARSVNAFFAEYVQPDGRVVRTDQGGDTVSEGQAYAMLLAVSQGNEARFAAVWAWTKVHLQQSDGLLAFRWSGGRLASTTPAADADLDTAWALALAAKRFGQPRDASQAQRISSAILGRETVSRGGNLVLVAGPWATGDPAVVDPSYFSPLAFAALGSLTHDPRWAQLQASSISVLNRLTTSAGGLPPDWASLSSSGKVSASAGPDGARGPRYGLDAARVEVWYASACGAGLSAVAARSWSTLSSDAAAQDFSISMTLSGQSRSPYVNPLMVVADAAAAAAAGQRAQAAQLLTSASRLGQTDQTYYGSAWLALGQVLLDTNQLGSCPIA